MKKANERALTLADLARSGLGEKDLKRMRLEPLAAAAAAKLSEGVVAVPSYRIPYLDPAGKPTGFYRVKLLETVGRGRPIRYWQPPNTLPRLFFPSAYKDWLTTLKDPRIPLYVTEGEKKAEKGAADGLAVLGLGGVWNWRSKKKVTGRSDVIADLDLIDWTDRSVIVVFDSDVTEKLDVQAALRALAEELIDRGARPSMLRLPAGANGAKVGLDDFLVAEKRPALEALEPAPILGRLADELWRLNQELAYVEESEAVWRFKTERLVSRAQLVDVAYANRTVAVVNLQGNVRQVSAAKEWLAWPCRRSIRRLTYAPGAGELLEDGALNLWKGWGLSPAVGDWSPWEELLAHLFASDPAGRVWFEKWCAYPLQHPGAKLYTAVVLLSLAHGVGKSLVGMTLGKIYGTNFSLLGQDELQSSFNGWAAGKQFVLGDEITGTERRKDADRIKSLVTRDLVTVNVKFQPQYVIPDCVNYLFTTNHPDAFVLERQDRRFFVHEIDAAPLDPAFYRRYDEWLRAGGAAALFHRLLAVDLKKFDPKAPAPLSEAKLRMVDLSLSDLDTFAVDLLRDPDQYLRVDGAPIPRDLYTLEELLGIADPLGSKRTTKIALAKSLRRAGFRQLEPTRVTRGVVKLWALRDQERWLASDAEARRSGYEARAPKLAVVKKKY